jgi:hypothetical protein
MAPLSAIACGPSGLRIQVEGASPDGSCQVPSSARPSSALRWNRASEGRKPRSGAAPRGAPSSRAFPRSRKNPGPLINALHAWLTDGPPAPPVTESWLLGVPDFS